MFCLISPIAQDPLYPVSCKIHNQMLGVKNSWNNRWTNFKSSDWVEWVQRLHWYFWSHSRNAELLWAFQSPRSFCPEESRFRSEGGFSSLMRHSALKHGVILKNHFKMTSFKSLLKTQEDFCSQLALWVMVGHIYDPVIIMTCFKKKYNYNYK